MLDISGTREQSLPYRPRLSLCKTGASSKPLLFDETDGKTKTYDDPTLARPAVTGTYMAH